MREIRKSGSEGGGTEINRSFLPLPVRRLWIAQSRGTIVASLEYRSADFSGNLRDSFLRLLEFTLQRVSFSGKPRRNPRFLVF
jgi:hypothetical protein